MNDKNETESTKNPDGSALKPFDIFLPGAKDKPPKFLARIEVEIDNRYGTEFLTKEARARIESITKSAIDQEKYYELLFAVESSFPGESRHETALRYIQEREFRSDGLGMSNAKKELTANISQR